MHCSSLDCAKGHYCFYCSRERYRLFNYKIIIDSQDYTIYKILPLLDGKIPRCHHIFNYFWYNSPELPSGFTHHINASHLYSRPTSINSWSDIEELYGSSDRLIYPQGGFKYGIMHMNGNAGVAVVKTKDNNVWVIDMSY